MTKFHRMGIGRIPSMLHDLTLRALLRSVENYHPVRRRGRIVAPGDRHCFDRWKLIQQEIAETGSRTLLDLGCAEGFYVIQGARELGCLSLGIDSDLRRLALAQSQTVSEGIEGTSFMLASLGPELIEKLWDFDVIVFMSVLHHLMYLHGEDYARNVMAALRGKDFKSMIFEMGQSNETANTWARKLPEMGANPHDWIREFLLSCGFARVEKIGESDSISKDQNRAIFRVRCT